MLSYRIILKQAWQITKKYKYLWFFALFASITAIGGSWEYNIIIQNGGGNIVDNSYAWLEKMIGVFDLITALGAGFVAMFKSGFFGIMNGLAIIITTIAILIAGIWLGISSQGALINSLKKILNNKNKKKEIGIRIRENLTVGHKNFWPLFGLNILIKLFVLSALFFIGLPLLILAIKDIAALHVLYIILFVIFIPLATGAALAVKYAVAYQVFDEKGFIVSLNRGLRLFIKNWLVSLEMAVILFIISFLTGMVFLGIIFFPLSLLFTGAIALQIMWLAYFILFIAIAAIIIFGTILTNFQVSAWMILFVEIKEKGFIAKLERLFRR
ncbi:MAG: hypothetical protein PF488_03270 [Patescibacteria group bacterium]|jgi:hypothetical protein|nr:hypothetical protein [Patescibacteria group bacterium]